MVIPGSSEKSLLVAAGAQINDDIAMPPKHGPGRSRRRSSCRAVQVVEVRPAEDRGGFGPAAPRADF